MVKNLPLEKEAVFPSPPTVPNPSNILSEIMPDSVYFPVIISLIFYSSPVHLNSRYWFWFGKQNLETSISLQVVN